MIEAHAAGARPLGELLVAQGLLAPEHLAAALAHQEQTGRPIGEVLVTLGYVAGEHIARALATQQGGAAASEYGVAVAFGAPTAGPAVIALPPTTGPSLGHEATADAANGETVGSRVAPEVDVEQLAQLRVELAAANAGRAELRAELDRQVAAAGEIEDLRVQVAELRGMADQVAALEAAAVQADQRLAAVVDEREALRQHADELRVHLAEQGVMADQIVALQAAASSAEQQLAVATDERDALQQHAEQMDSELAAAVGARDEACAQLEELRVHAVGQGGMAEQVAALEAAAVQAEQRLALITEERNALREQAAAAANRHEEIDLHSGELEALRTELATAAAERDELRQQRAAGDVRAQTDLEQRLATLETRLEGALDTLEGFGADRSIVDELEQRLAAAAATNREAAHAILALEGRLAEAHDELARQQPATTQRLADSQYFVFLSAVGAYALVERQGRIPQPGETLTVDGIAHVVSRVGWTLGADRPTVHTIPV